MRRTRLRIKLFGFFLALAITACILPGQTSPSAPIIDQGLVGTSIAEAIGTASIQTEQASLITPTLTPVPTETSTPVPVFSSYGTSVKKHEDGSVTFIDQRAKMQILFPANWLALRVGEPEYYQAWEKEGAQSPLLLDAITSTQNLDLNRFRITAYDMHPEHVLYDNLPKINIVFIEGDVRSLQQVEIDESNRSSVLTGYNVLPSEFKKTSTGIDILIVQYQWDIVDHYTGYYRGVLFKVPDGTVAVDLFIPFDIKEPLEQELNQIIESLTILN